MLLPQVKGRELKSSTLSDISFKEVTMAVVNEDTVRQAENLVRMVSLKYERQKKALADTELQLRGAKEFLENAKKQVK